MTPFDTGRLCAIVKILDQASMQLRLAAREVPGSTAPEITSLLGVSEHASAGVRRALVHIRNGETQRALAELEGAGKGPRGQDFGTAWMPRPLPARVTTALRLMRGITGFFPAETEQALVQKLHPAGWAAASSPAG
ncbi:hypothetical protein ACFQVC_09140 [Streptomyces monticola]|uniref:MarR family transcriptional regulator n=1 Tax=Streptomyces monticola TaxID=2666263 RepID=A0ABW2JGG1_9ACTN